MKRNSSKENCVVYLSNLPKQNSSISHIYRHFCRFGVIQAIYHERDRASILFDSPSHAEAAVESSEPFADNRFVKISMHRYPENSQVFLDKAIDLSKIERIASETKTEIDQKQFDNIMKQYKEMKRNDYDRDIKRLNNSRDALMNEASSLMEKLETLQGDEKAQLKKRIFSLSALIKENEAKIRELEEMKEEHLNEG